MVTKRDKYFSEYCTWAAMKQRCYNQNNPEYFRYGAKGVYVEKSWKDSFDKFFSDMGARPTAKHTLDRVDPSAGYSKDNCRWATKSTQSFNQGVSVDNKSGITGVQFREKFNTYRIYISVDKKRIHIGSTRDFFEACCMRKVAENKHYGNIKQY